MSAGEVRRLADALRIVARQIDRGDTAPDTLTIRDAAEEIERLTAEVGRLNALAGPGGKSLGELERVNDDFIAEHERLTAERESLQQQIDAESAELDDIRAELHQRAMLICEDDGSPMDALYLLRAALDERDSLRAALQSIVDCCDEDHAARDYASRQTEIRGIARAVLAGRPPAAELLPPGYMLAKLGMVVPLLQEARDALTALTVAQCKLHGIRMDLGARMDIAGTFSLDDWRALAAKEQPK